MWWLCAASALLLTRGTPPAAAAACEGELADVQLDLPNEDVYTCTEGYVPPPQQVLPSVASVYQEEISPWVCTDTAIVYTATIPNSGAHRPTWAKYGEYIYCPPQQWVHNLQHGGVAFLYHPCVHPKLKEAISSLARRSIAKHIITPLHTLSRDRPLAVAAWCSTLEMSHINRTEIIGWLMDNVHIKRHYEKGKEGSYQHLLIRPSMMATGDSSMYWRMLHSRLRRRAVKQRWRRLVLPVTPAAKKTVDNVSHSVPTTPTVPQTGELANNRTSCSSTSVTANVRYPPDPVTTRPTVYVPQDTDTESLKADIHSRELDGNREGEMPANNSISTPRNITSGLSGVNLSHSVGGSTSKEAGHHDEKEQLLNSAEAQEVDSPESKQSEGYLSSVLLPTPTPENQATSTDQQAVPPDKSSSDSEGQKPNCKCQQDTTLQLPAKAQRRLGVSQQKSAGMFVSTPRTEEAKWAAASLVFLFVLLIFAVLYTQIYKKFRKSQSLYWTPGSHSEEESVASVIKRRLVQGHSIRKKWIGRKKNPVLLYESLSDNSD